jgi:hypothetical protein
MWIVCVVDIMYAWWMRVRFGTVDPAVWRSCDVLIGTRGTAFGMKRWVGLPSTQLYSVVLKK